jgi:carboxyl-terminal processing protease
LIRISKDFFRKVIFLSIFFALFYGHCISQLRVEKDTGQLSRVLGTIDSIYRRITNNYVADVDLDKLMRKGIDAMFQSLDPYTVFMSKEEADAFQFLA